MLVPSMAEQHETELAKCAIVHPWHRIGGIDILCWRQPLHMTHAARGQGGKRIQRVRPVGMDRSDGNEPR